ncbi:PilZ domain-containing protein [Pseudoalteromonas sp. SSDWG2]|uniref:PilZ domain-containing protein n=1 Tax=Pseudoalteromonas sp. SSDWG2 TaxID=3139391 RepID=UPI003BA871D4
MADDILQKHQPLIDELKQSLGEKSFNSEFTEKTAELSKGDQFIIKMELNRLRQPCSRALDLRGLTTAEIQTYSHNNQDHFLDHDAILVFEDGVKRFGEYTLAVYEMVMEQLNSRRQQRQQQRLEEDTEPTGANLIRFASYESRQQERMNYAIKVRVMVNDKRIDGKTSDISLGGCKLKLPCHSMLESEQIIRVRFTGLEEDFELGLKEGVEYEVVAIEPSNDMDFYYARLKRAGSQKTPGFDEFLSRFIDGNKRRYKVNLDNTLDAVMTKGFEQYYVPRITSLYAFICEHDKKLHPRVLLTTENSLDSHYYFNDEQRHSMIPNILRPQRLNSILARKGQIKQTLLYTFTHTHNEQIFFYSATDLELATYPELRALFFAYGSRKPSWRVHKLQLMPVRSGDAHIALSLPDSAGEAIAKLNKPPSARVMSYLRGLKYLCLLTPIDSPALTKRLQRYKLDKSLVNQLKVFGHRRTVTPDLEVVALEYANLRAHKRYLYQTQVQVLSGLGQAQGAQTRDFSVLGMQIELQTPVKANKGDVLEIELPELQALTKKYKLTALPYEVMALSKTGTILNLKAHQRSKQPHAGVMFFSQLIENNKDKLQVCEEEPKVPGLSKALRNIVIKNVCQTPLYFTKEEAHFKLGAIGLGRYQSTLHYIWRHFGELTEHPNLDALSHNKALSPLLDVIRDGNRQDKARVFDLFIHIDPKQDQLKDALTVRCINVNQDYTQLNEFISTAIKSGVLFSYRLFLSVTGRPDTKYLISELKYISHYALHKAKELEKSLWEVEGVMDTLTIDELLPRLFNIDIKAYQTMVVRRNTWLQRIN